MEREKSVIVFSLIFPMVLYAENIEFECKPLEKIVEETIGIENKEVTRDDIKKLLELRCNTPSEVYSLEGIEYAENLEILVFTNNKTSDISAINKLTKLKYVDLSFNEIINIQPLSNLENLCTINLKNNSIVDISPLIKLKKIELLLLYGNPLSEDSYSLYLPVIEKNNPEAKIYHDRALHPERTLFIARQVFQYGLISLCLLVFFIVLLRKTGKLKGSTG
jgi:hypothetical protein